MPPNLLLRLEPDLAHGAAAMTLPPPNPSGPGVDVPLGATAHMIGDAFEEFVVNALALRLECVQQKAAAAAASAAAAA